MSKIVKVKTGDIIKNYRDEYARVIAIRKGRAFLSVWTRKESVAKKLERVGIQFNSIGVSNAMKQAVELINDKPAKEKKSKDEKTAKESEKESEKKPEKDEVVKDDE